MKSASEKRRGSEVKRRDRGRRRKKNNKSSPPSSSKLMLRYRNNKRKRQQSRPGQKQGQGRGLAGRRIKKLQPISLAQRWGPFRGFTGTSTPCNNKPGY